MRILVFFLLMGSARFALSNTNNFVLRLDQFIIAQSSVALNDTIDMTKDAWLKADTLHIDAYICGSDQRGLKCSFLARDENKMLFQEEYINKTISYSFSFATSRIYPEKIKYLAMTIGAASSENKYGWKYRMGVLRFI